MKLVNLEQRVIVPITDQTKGGIQYEVEISIEELLKGSLEDFEPILVDAIPVAWMGKFCADDIAEDQRETIEWMLKVWKREQEAK